MDRVVKSARRLDPCEPFGLVVSFPHARGMNATLRNTVLVLVVPLASPVPVSEHSRKADTRSACRDAFLSMNRNKLGNRWRRRHACLYHILTVLRRQLRLPSTKITGHRNDTECSFTVPPGLPGWCLFPTTTSEDSSPLHESPTLIRGETLTPE